MDEKYHTLGLGIHGRERRSIEKAKKARVKRRGENSFMISVNVGQVNENKNYTGPEFTDGLWRIAEDG